MNDFVALEHFKKSKELKKLKNDPLLQTGSEHHTTKHPDRTQKSEAITVNSNSLKPEHTGIKQSKTRTQRNQAV